VIQPNQPAQSNQHNLSSQSLPSDQPVIFNHPNVPNNNLKFTFLQYNCNRITNSVAKLGVFLHKYSIMVACIQEIKFTSRSKNPSIPGYTLGEIVQLVGVVAL
jgi:hypothetical protein